MNYNGFNLAITSMMGGDAVGQCAFGVVLRPSDTAPSDPG